MKSKIKTAPLCRGAERIAKITLLMIFFATVYIFLSVKDLDSATLMRYGDGIFEMIRDVMASIALSVGGVLFYDWYYKRGLNDDD